MNFIRRFISWWGWYDAATPHSFNLVTGEWRNYARDSRIPGIRG